MDLFSTRAEDDSKANQLGYDSDDTQAGTAAAGSSYTIHKGSEDLIVLNSDDEDEELELEDARRMSRSFDFNKFRFTPS
jgi:hypothetical protein